jgi:hypothetical protein
VLLIYRAMSGGGRTRTRTFLGGIGSAAVLAKSRGGGTLDLVVSQFPPI